MKRGTSRWVPLSAFCIVVLGVFLIHHVECVDITPVPEEVCIADGTCTEINVSQNGFIEEDIVYGDENSKNDESDEYEEDDHEDDYDDDEDDEEHDDDYSEEIQIMQKSDFLTDTLCYDSTFRCEEYAEEGECEANPDWMLNFCRLSCKTCVLDKRYGVEQDVHGGGEDLVSELQSIVDKSKEYIDNIVMVDEEYAIFRDECKNFDTQCAYWKYLGECTNPEDGGWMEEFCGPVCEACGETCPKKPLSENIWEPGDLNKFFERLTTDEKMKHYKPTILSRPPPDGISSEELEQLQNRTDLGYKIGTWIVVLDEFITDEECQALIDIGYSRGFERSGIVNEDEDEDEDDKTDKDKDDKDDKEDDEEEYDDYRTSENTWCDQTCKDNPMANKTLNRIQEITGISDEYSEFLQLLKYEEGQFYGVHHDLIPGMVESLAGPRILTVFVYLNDVEEGGGTRFSELNLTVTPKKGRAVIWPSVTNDDVEELDDFTWHEALPVTKGQKFGANAWIHLRVTKPYIDGECDGLDYL